MIRNGQVILLEDITVDKTLPKYKKEEKPKVHEGDFLNGFDGDGFISSPSSISFSNNTENDSHLEYMEYQYKNAPSFFLKFKIWLFKSLYSSNFDIAKKTPLNIEGLKEFFDSIKESVKELDENEINEILAKYKTVLINAQDNNQIALIEKIKDYAKTLKYELVLSTSKFNKFLTEKDIVDFHNVASVHEKYRTGLCLTYVKNFVKVIPNEVTEAKKEADKLKVFDNYVVLHYDYSGKAVEDTKAEKEKKKDPILFGVISGSKNLYFIGDWIDEYCDLTLDVVIKKLGKEINVLDSETVKKNIERI